MTVQAWDAACYARNARFVSDLGAPLLDLLSPRPGERILDLGCGDGALTEKLVAAGAIVVGVDASPDMVAAAKGRGIDARVMDGQALTFSGEFDAVFSNAALHWMKREGAVIQGAHRALKPGGRVVAELGGGDNVATVRAAIHAELARRGLDPWSFDPWTFPTAEDYRARLESHGFTVASCALLPRPTPVPGRLADWLDTFAGTFLGALPVDQREAFKNAVEDRTAPALHDARGWHVDYVRLRVLAARS
ncbi:MAG: class I SAM-dependent methyltransferase [Alphaproteobacteria bacterium]|nr:class I SAM-dependent methyltransferase [Alphaproteobacteria bacterium]